MLPGALPMKTEFKSTTTGLLVAFAKAFFEVKLAYKNKALMKAALISADATQMKTVVASSSSDLPESTATLNSILTKLKAVGTPATKQSYEMYNSLASQLLEKIKEHVLKQDMLQSDFDNLCNNVFDNVREALQRVEKAPDVEATASDQATQNVLSTAQQTIQAKKTELAKLKRDSENYQQDINAIIVPAFKALPIQEQNATQVPLQVTRETMTGRIRGG